MRIAAVVSIALVAILAMLLAGSCAVRGNGPYVDGKKHGRWVFRFADGGVQEGSYVDGKNHGRWVFRLAGGSVVSETTWVDGVPEY